MECRGVPRHRNSERRSVTVGLLNFRISFAGAAKEAVVVYGEAGPLKAC